MLHVPYTKLSTIPQAQQLQTASTHVCIISQSMPALVMQSEAKQYRSHGVIIKLGVPTMLVRE